MQNHHSALRALLATPVTQIQENYQQQQQQQQEEIPLDEYSSEPRRAKLNLDDLPIKENGGVNNIIEVYNQATPAEKDYWGRWYHHAHQDVQELAHKYKIDFRVAAGIAAVLSPGSTWMINIRAAERTIEGADNGSIPGYPANIIKAKEILAGADPVSKVTGPKVSVFLQSLLNPDAVDKDMVLDGHAINIWRGVKRPLKNLGNPGVQERRQMIADYGEAAKQLGVSTQSVQAVTWYIWKYSKQTPALTLTPMTTPGTSAGQPAE